MGHKSSRSSSSSGSSTTSYLASSSSTSSSSSSSRTNSSSSTTDSTCTVKYIKIPKRHSRTLEFMAYATGAPYKATAIKKITSSPDGGSILDYGTELYWVTGYRPESPPSFVDRGRPASPPFHPPEKPTGWHYTGPPPAVGGPARNAPVPSQGRAPGPSYQSGPASAAPFIPGGGGPAFPGRGRPGVPGGAPIPRPPQPA